MSLIPGDSILTDPQTCRDAVNNFHQIRSDGNIAAETKETKETLKPKASNIKLTNPAVPFAPLINSMERNSLTSIKSHTAGPSNGNRRG